MNLLFITEQKESIQEIKLEIEKLYKVNIADNLETTINSLLQNDIDYVFIDKNIVNLREFEILKLINNLVSKPQIVAISRNEIQGIDHIKLNYLQEWSSELIKDYLGKNKNSGSSFNLIQLDTRKMTAIFQEEEIGLTEIEIKILMLFISNPNKVIRKEEITRLVWNNHIKSRHNLATHLYNLKEKLPILKDMLINSRGRGYYLKVN